MAIEDFSATHEIDESILPCQHGNLFYIDMPQAEQDKIQLSFGIGAERTPTLPAETPYRHINTREGTSGALRCYIQGYEHTLIPDLSEAAGITSPEDLKVLVGFEPPAPEMVAEYHRLERVKELIRSDGRVTSPVTTSSRISRLEQMIKSGVADNEHQEELIQIMQRVESQTGEYFLIPTPIHIVGVEMSPENVLPSGQYDIETLTGVNLDKIGNTILGVFDENFDTIIGYLEAGKDLVVSNLPAAFIEYASAQKILQNMAANETNFMRSMGGVRNLADQRFIDAIRSSPAAREAFKKAFIKTLLKQEVLKIQLFPNSRTILSFKTHAKIKMSFGAYNTRGVYRSSLFEASGRVSGGRFASVAGGAFRGVAAVGVAFAVYGEVKTFFDTPEAEREWSDLFVGLGVEMVKIAISAVAGAMLTAAGLALAAAVGFGGAPLWFVILAGAGVALIVSATIDYLDGEFGVKDGIKDAVRSIEPVTRYGDSIRW